MTTAATQQGTGVSLDVARVRRDFPILAQTVYGKPLAYLDNAATSQKPQCVIDAIARYYAEDNANIHRAVHILSERATRQYEEARAAVQRFLNAPDAREVIFTRGTTEGINLVAHGWGRKHLGPGDEVLITGMEHHSNIVPWQIVCQERGARLRVAPIDDRGELLMDEFVAALGPRTRLVAAVHVSNSLGTVNPVERMVALAHDRGIPVLLDGAQAVPHSRVDVQALDCEFYTFSGHKVYGPTGIGALYGKASMLRDMLPYQGGGDMIRSVTFEATTYADIPARFEAGTPHIAGAVGLAAALGYVEQVGIDAIAAYEAGLLDYGTRVLNDIPGLRIIGTARHKAAVLSFVMEGAHPHDVGTILDREGVAVRTGHHCTQPLMERFGVPATTRASLAFYNTREDLDALGAGLRRVVEVLR